MDRKSTLAAHLEESYSNSLLVYFAMIIAGSIVIALSAQVIIPFWPVPVTGQTFGVLLVAALLGRKRGTAAVLAYLAEGAMGLPVFAGGSAGFMKFAGPTGGYLIGFIVAAYVTGLLVERVRKGDFVASVIAMTAGTVVIFIFGLAQLSIFTGFGDLLAMGFIPFIPGAVIKIIAAALVFTGGMKLIEKK